MARNFDPGKWSCPLPLRSYPNVVLGHGSGGQLTADLIQQLFLPAFRNSALEALGDSAVVAAGGASLAFSTDAYVVRPLVFPGGSIGELAVNGTINDLAMAGARPLFLSAAFLVEEGFPMEELGGLVQRMAAAARQAGVEIVTGDTKVVDKGHGDGCYITTAGIGLVPEGVQLGPGRIEPGDAVILSGAIGDHGIAVLSVREGLEFGTRIESDTAALHTLAGTILETPAAVRLMRDPTRGGVAAALNEIAAAAGKGVLLDEEKIPVRAEVEAACELLGLDPLTVANEGKLLAVVDPGAAPAILERMRAHPLGRDAQVIGRITAEHPGTVALHTGIGASRVVPMPVGELLPRIC